MICKVSKKAERKSNKSRRKDDNDAAEDGEVEEILRVASN